MGTQANLLTWRVGEYLSVNTKSFAHKLTISTHLLGKLSNFWATSGLISSVTSHCPGHWEIALIDCTNLSKASVTPVPPVPCIITSQAVPQFGHLSATWFRVKSSCSGRDSSAPHSSFLQQKRNASRSSSAMNFFVWLVIQCLSVALLFLWYARKLLNSLDFFPFWEYNTNHTWKLSIFVACSPVARQLCDWSVRMNSVMGWSVRSTPPQTAVRYWGFVLAGRVKSPKKGKQSPCTNGADGSCHLDKPRWSYHHRVDISHTTFLHYTAAPLTAGSLFSFTNPAWSFCYLTFGVYSNTATYTLDIP